ncbi:MAG: hypothetical protein WC175_02910 [Candidatus Dojkabacteria bacterium]
MISALKRLERLFYRNNTTQTTGGTSSTDELNQQLINTDGTDFLKTLPSTDGYPDLITRTNIDNRLRTTDRRLVDYFNHYSNDLREKISNRKINPADYSYAYFFKTSLFYIVKGNELQGATRRDVSEYIVHVEEYANFEEQIMNFFRIKMALPRWLYTEILLQLSKNSEGNPAKFYLSIDKFKKLYKNVSSESTGFLVPEATSGYFSENLYKNLAIIPIDNDNKLTGQFSFQELVTKPEEQDNDTKYILELDLFPEIAVAATKKTFDYDATNIPDLKTFVNSILEHVNNSTGRALKQIIYDEIHNTNSVANLSIEKMGLVELVSYIDQYFGLYTFGSLFFFNCDTLYFSDANIESPSLKDKPRVYINIFPNASTPEFATDGMVFLDGNIYCNISETSIGINDTSSSALEIFGDNIIINSKVGQTTLLLPRKMIKRNIISGEDKKERTKSYTKNDDSVFYETRLIQGYNKDCGSIDITINNVDPDYFFIGRHVYLNFINPNFEDMYSDQYYVSNKTVVIDRKSPNLNGNKIRLQLRRAVNEIPYRYSDQIQLLPIYSEPDIREVPPAMTSLYDSSNFTEAGGSSTTLPLNVHTTPNMSMYERVSTILKNRGFEIYTDPYKLNIVSIRSNNRVANQFDDLMFLFFKDANGDLITREYTITTDPGLDYIRHPLNAAGAAILVSGQYVDVYIKGTHRGHPALVQAKNYRVYRDNNRNNTHDIDRSENDRNPLRLPIQSGLFGMQIHSSTRNNGLKSESSVVGKWSAGCQVFKRLAELNEFLSIVDLAIGRGIHRFTYTLINSNDPQFTSLY